MALQLKNPFKKQEDQLRAADGKFTSGNGGVNTLKNFNWKRTLPVAVIVALFGGLLVFRSFASPALYSYQYSVSSCSDKSKTTNASKDVASPESTKAVDATDQVDPDMAGCQAKSAEALAYRLLKGIQGTEPTKGDVAYWTQQLAGDRVRPSVVAEKLTSKKDIAALSTADYISRLYKNMLGKTRPDDRGLAFWTKHLNDKSWSRAKTAVQFAIQNGAVTNNSTGFAAYLASAPAVKIKFNAKTAQTSRAATIKNVYIARAKSAAQASAKQVTNSKSNQRVVESLAAIANPTRAELDSIGGNQKTVEGYLAKAQKAHARLVDDLKHAKNIAANAAAVAKYSPDISDSDVKTQLTALNTAVKLDATNIQKLQNAIKAIAANYQSTRAKYEAAQQAAAAAASDQASGSGGGGYDTPDPSDHTPVPRGGSESDKIAACKSKTGSYRYHSSYRHVTYTIKYHKKYDGIGACVIDKSTKVALNDDNCDGGYIPNGAHNCKPNPANAGAAQRNCVKDGGRWSSGKCTYPARCTSSQVKYGGKCVTVQKAPYHRCNFSAGEHNTTCRDNQVYTRIEGNLYITKWRRKTVGKGWKVTNHEWHTGVYTL